MRFKKGSKVEVLNKTEVPSGSWRCGEIISGNGHNYSVRYDCSSGLTSEAVVERVSRKTIRPSPPLVDGVKSWMVGDVVEVFNDFCWKIARVLTLIGGGCYFVRLLGSRQELSIHKSNIRLRQSWQDDKWVVIGKGPSTSRDVRFNMPPTVNCYQKSFLELPADTKRKEAPAGECLALWHNAGLASKFLEGASSYRSTHFEAYGGNSRKRRVIETEARRQRVFPASPLGKGQSWRHECIASKGLKMIPLSLGVGTGAISAINFLQLMQFMASHWNHYLLWFNDIFHFWSAVNSQHILC